MEWEEEGRGKGSPNEAPKKPQTHRVKLLRGYLRQTLHLLALVASPGHMEGNGGGAMHI